MLTVRKIPFHIIYMRKFIKENLRKREQQKHNNNNNNNKKQEEPEAAFNIKSNKSREIRRLKIIKKNLSAADFET